MSQALTMQSFSQTLTHKLEDVKSKLKEHDVKVAAGIVAATIGTLAITVLTGGLGLIVAAGVLGGVVLVSGGSVAANHLSEDTAEPKGTLTQRTLKPVQPQVQATAQPAQRQAMLAITYEGPTLKDMQALSQPSLPRTLFVTDLRSSAPIVSQSQPMLAITYEAPEQEETQDVYEVPKTALPLTDAVDHCIPSFMQSLFLRSAAEPKQPHNPDPLVNCDAASMQNLFGAPTVHPSFKDIVNGQHKNVQEAPIREGLGKSTKELRREAMLARQEAKLDCLSGCDSKTMQNLFGSTDIAHRSFKEIVAGDHKVVRQEEPRGLGKSTVELRKEAIQQRQEADVDFLSGCDAATMQNLFGAAHASYRDLLARNL